ncbi:phage portal protein family protein [Chitinophaga sp. 22536]|uniref:phage portal protein family protein n=1 Tax=unclassified Chitinophaga TaxID=2619133 RepID=UPI003F87CBA7
MSFFGNIQNAVQFGLGGQPTRPATIADPKSSGAIRNLSKIIAPVQLQRLRHDIQMWREAVTEAELAWYPHRVRMQRLFIDTILNGHVGSLMERRADLSLLRDYKLCDKKGIESEVMTQYFEEQDWFSDYLGYGIDTLFFGYSLVSLGDIKDDAFPDLSLVRRWNVSPDRLQVTQLVYSLDGINFMEEPYSDWHIWMRTKSETGVNNCGYGLFYKIGLYEILLRNTLGYNADFVELYAMPYRLGKTSKTTETERAEMEQALQSMGSAGYAIIDPMDEIQFLESKLGGTGWESYDNLEQRCVKTVTKLVLGHEDAMSSTPGKLGAGGAKEDNPITIAILSKQTKDGHFLESLVNKQLLPRMRKLGFRIPDTLHFEFKNDEEKEAFRRREDESNQATAKIFQTISQAGGSPDWDYFTDRTGIKVNPAAPKVESVKGGDTKEVEEEDVDADDDEDDVEITQSVQNIQNQITKLYGR